MCGGSTDNSTGSTANGRSDESATVASREAANDGARTGSDRSGACHALFGGSTSGHK
jgi:hypothetical protein